MVLMPSNMQGKGEKADTSLPWAVSILSVTQVVFVERPKEPSIFILLDRVFVCYAERTDESWNRTAQEKEETEEESCASRRHSSSGF